MIDLTPLEVRKKKGDFRKALRGYEPGLVDDFLDVVADRLEQLVRENLSLNERLGGLENQVAEKRERERALTDALVTAQEMREEMRAQTAREADLMRKTAEQETSQLRRTTEQETSQMRRSAEQEVAQLRHTAEQEAAHIRSEAMKAREREEEVVRRLRARQQQLLQSYRTFLAREMAELQVIGETLEIEGLSAMEPPRPLEMQRPLEMMRGGDASRTSERPRGEAPRRTARQEPVYAPAPVAEPEPIRAAAPSYEPEPAREPEATHEPEPIHDFEDMHAVDEELDAHAANVVAHDEARFDDSAFTGGSKTEDVGSADTLTSHTENISDDALDMFDIADDEIEEAPAPMRMLDMPIEELQEHHEEVVSVMGALELAILEDDEEPFAPEPVDEWDDDAVEPEIGAPDHDATVLLENALKAGYRLELDDEDEDEGDELLLDETTDEDAQPPKGWLDKMIDDEER